MKKPRWAVSASITRASSSLTTACASVEVAISRLASPRRRCVRSENTTTPPDTASASTSKPNNLMLGVSFTLRPQKQPRTKAAVPPGASRARTCSRLYGTPFATTRPQLTLDAALGSSVGERRRAEGHGWSILLNLMIACVATAQSRREANARWEERGTLQAPSPTRGRRFKRRLKILTRLPFVLCAAIAALAAAPILAQETKAPDTKATEAKTPETKTPETKTPEAKTPETKTAEAKTPEAKTPEAKTPEAKRRERRRRRRQQRSAHAGPWEIFPTA